MSYPKVDILYLSEKDMLDAGVNDVVKCTDTMEEVVKLLDDGDYRMGGENGNSHGCMISFPDNPAFPNMPTKWEKPIFSLFPIHCRRCRLLLRRIDVGLRFRLSVLPAVMVRRS